MKTGKILVFSLAIILLSGTGLHDAAGQEINKTYKWTYDVTPGEKIAFENYDTGVDIRTWDKPEIELHMTIEAEFKNESDASKLDNYLNNLEFTSSAGRTAINSKFWKSRNNIFGISTMNIEGMKALRIEKFKMECLLWIPADAALELTSRYSEINMEDIGGELILDLYNDDLYAGSVGGNSSIDAKYSKMNFREMKNINAKLYNCELTTADVGDMIIDSKYSEINCANAGTTGIESYEDEFVFENNGDIKFIAKYSELTTGKADNLVADTYECEFSADRIKGAKVSSKYSSWEILSADILVFESLYEDELTSDKIRSLKVSDSKYSDFNIESLENSIIFEDAYENEINIEKLEASLKRFRVEGKYIDIDLGIASALDCKINAVIKYPELDIDEDLFRTKIMIKDGSDLEYEAVKGMEKEDMTELVIKGYEIKLSVIEY